MRRTATVALALLVSFGGAAACGDDDDSETSAGDDTASQAEEDSTNENSPEGFEEPGDETDPTGGKTKPEVTVPATAPTELVVTDIEVGTGATAENGKTLSMQYVGVSFSTKEQFDASWDAPGPRPFQFVLGTGGVIDGWDQGLVGMKVGGRRQLVIPPNLGYGAAGYPPVIAPNETLVFVVDLIAVS
jgi:peptidylprolyl isomerase